MVFHVFQKFSAPYIYSAALRRLFRSPWSASAAFGGLALGLVAGVVDEDGADFTFLGARASEKCWHISGDNQRDRGEYYTVHIWPIYYITLNFAKPLGSLYGIGQADIKPSAFDVQSTKSIFHFTAGRLHGLDPTLLLGFWGSHKMFFLTLVIWQMFAHKWIIIQAFLWIVPRWHQPESSSNRCRCHSSPWVLWQWPSKSWKHGKPTHWRIHSAKGQPSETEAVHRQETIGLGQRDSSSISPQDKTHDFWDGDLTNKC